VWATPHYAVGCGGAGELQALVWQAGERRRAGFRRCPIAGNGKSKLDLVGSRRPGIQPKCFLRTATFRRWSPTAPIEACRCLKRRLLPEICRLGGKSLARIGRRIAAPASAATGLPSTRQTFGNVAASTAWTTLPHFATAWRQPASHAHRGGAAVTRLESQPEVAAPGLLSSGLQGLQELLLD